MRLLEKLADTVRRHPKSVPFSGSFDRFKGEAVAGGGNGYNFTLEYPSDPDSDVPAFQVSLTDNPKTDAAFLELNHARREAGFTSYPHRVSMGFTTVRGEPRKISADNRGRVLSLWLPNSEQTIAADLEDAYFFLGYGLERGSLPVARLREVSAYVHLHRERVTSQERLPGNAEDALMAQHPWTSQGIDLQATADMYLSGKTPDGAPLTAAYLHASPVILVPGE